jgi:fluoroquinolone resistance protein
VAERRQGVPETGSTVEFEDWGGDDLSGQRHENVLFREVDMTESTGQGTVFHECVFRGVRFNAASYTDAAFVNCAFIRCAFFDATFTGCKFVGSVFDGCTFDLMKAEGGDWSFAGLRKAPLGGASFTGVRMREADLTGVRCEGATLRGIDLSGALLHNADLTRADLRGSDLSSLDPLTAQLKDAVIDMAQAMTIATALGLDVRPS